jgi:hypothetical protein
MTAISFVRAALPPASTLPWLALSASVWADAAGPDHWRVAKVSADDHLLVHAEPSARSPVSGHLSHHAFGAQHLDEALHEADRLSAAGR